MTDEPRAQRRRRPWWLSAMVYVSATLALALAVTTFVVQPFVIPSSSMVPALAKGDRILVQKWTYRGGEPQRGDVVVFRDPGGWLGELDDPSAFQRGLRAVGLAPQGGYLVKRVVGVAGDEVRCCDEAGRPLVNGHAIDEPYLADVSANAARTFQATVPRGMLWVEGDNRGDSRDSRAMQDEPGEGFVPADSVVGRVWARAWPTDRTGPLRPTDAFADVPSP
ncbi:signal peptidase I [Aeromicrobium sp. Marseille-Q0843]|uniref:Signal peptidase I n=1 Tax=Aeromicrobium phoceense TaxID=2754045 RepID=A0A838XKD4_9ACTN|nr:signal peptidase I [Aeromicrobium phoceense]